MQIHYQYTPQDEFLSLHMYVCMGEEESIENIYTS